MNHSSHFQRFASAQALETYLVEDALKQYDQLFGQEFGGYVYLTGLEDTIALDSAPVATPTSAEASFSTTNTQVDGVDEADLIETDGQFIYQVNGQLMTIVDARNEKDLGIATQFSFDPNDSFGTTSNSGTNGTNGLSLAIDYFYPIEGWRNIDGMYLQGDRLTVIASGWSPIDENDDQNNGIGTSFYDPYSSGTNEVQVTVFDVANPEDINVLESTTLEGSLISSRAIGDDVFVVTSHNFQLPGPEVIPNRDSSTDVSSTDQEPNRNASSLSYLPYPGPRGTYETKEQYLERIEGQELDLALPNMETVDGQGNEVASGLLSQPTDIYLPLDKYPWQLTTVSTFDVGDNNLGVDAATSIPTDWVGEVFASKDYLYLLKTNYSGNQSTTEILQYDLESSALIAKGEVPGSIDNQFSVDEHKGFLRISTTTGFGNQSSNNVYILEREGATLDIVGEVENLAPGERIFSTRFQGDYGFVVTFRQVDPLFALDLSDPTNPEVKGELKIPGFSEYLQVIEDGDRTLLLGVGRDADPETGRAEALKVSLFDVTDLTNPTEIDNYIFEGDFTSSEALWDHLAITYSPVHKMLAIPAQYYNYQEYSSQTKLHVFEVDGTDGLSSLGEVDHGDNWINRSLYIDDTLFAVSGQEISAHRIPTLQELDSVSWSGQGQGGEIFLPIDSVPFTGETVDEVISGNLNGDVIRGNEGHDEIRGEGGDDDLQGDEGNDQLFGGMGKDDLRGGYGQDQLFGGRGNDFLSGGREKDELNGGPGQDRLVGGGDADVLTGGAGRDRIYIKKHSHSSLKAYDSITDFAIGKDKIKGPYAIAAADVQQLGAIDDLQPQSIRTVLTRSTFRAKGAATFTVGEDTFLALNNQDQGFQSKADVLVKITGFSGDLENLQIF